jgi:hypothetical protein
VTDLSAPGMKLKLVDRRRGRRDEQNGPLYVRDTIAPKSPGPGAA